MENTNRNIDGNLWDYLNGDDIPRFIKDEQKRAIKERNRLRREIEREENDKKRR